jgi:dihydroorotase
MNCIIRGVRVIDPLARLDAAGQDVWLSDGRIIAIYKHIGEGTLPVIDLTPPKGGQPCVLCPGFIDLHTHLRQAPHADDEMLAENVLSGTMAAAAGGFTQIVAMANTDPVIDTPQLVSESVAFSADAPVRVLPAAAVSLGLKGEKLVDIPGCVASGAACFSDDGRNLASQRLLAQALSSAGAAGRAVFIHPEDEEMIGKTNPSKRPPAVEVQAIETGLRALSQSKRGRLHLQHVSTEGGVELLAKAKHQGLRVTAEVTPHHLGMWWPMETQCDPAGLARVNPPLRSESDRQAVVQALREGIIDAVATDHAPQRPEQKAGKFEKALPGIIGLETALASCLTIGAMGGDWLPILVRRLTTGPYRVLGEGAGGREPRLRIGEAATCVLFDPADEWEVGEKPLFTGGKNTPLWGQKVRGRVLMTLVDGAAVYHDTARLPWSNEYAHA